MKRTKRLICVLLIAALMLGLFSACGNDAPAEESEVDVPTVLEFSIGPNNELIVENPPATAYYEILGDGELIGVASADTIEGWVVPDGMQIQIRYVDELGEPLSDWSDPQLSHTFSGPTDPPMNGAGENQENMVDEWETSLENLEYVKRTCESITFSATENTIDNLVLESDGSYTMTAYSNRGNAYRFRLEGSITPVEGAWGQLKDTSVFYNLDITPGIVGRIFTSRDPQSWFGFSYGYELDGNDTVQKKEDMDVWLGALSVAAFGYTPATEFPNYILIGTEEGVGTDHVLDEITIYFDGNETVYDSCTIHDVFYYELYLTGAMYQDPPGSMDLELYFLHDGVQSRSVDYFGGVQVGALRDADGNEITERPYYLNADDTLDITFACGFQTRMKLTEPALSGMQTVNEARGYSYSDTVGTMNVLVVPMYWSDQADRANEHSMDLIYRALGNIMDINGNVTTYAPTDPTELSLSEFYRISSYGQLTINAFVTDWYARSESFSEVFELSMNSDYRQIYQWILEQYPDLDLTRFDNDKDGILDEVIFVNTGDLTGRNGYITTSYAGAYRYTSAFARADVPCQEANVEQPAIHHYINFPLGFLFKNKIIGEAENIETSTILHEFGHSLGLRDYYDLGNKVAVSFVGGFDMMDYGEGDMNVYAKYALGWITPTVVDESSFAESETVTVTLRSSTLTGDALLIPAAGYDYNGTPFDEYLMVDLFTPEGLNEKDSANYGLEDSMGVRIYHVSNLMQEYIVDQQPFYAVTGRQIHVNDTSDYWCANYGMCEIELVPANGKQLWNQITESALFMEGSRFSPADYSSIFYEGRMDRCADFGYEIEVVSIEQVDGEYVATVQVTRTGK